MTKISRRNVLEAIGTTMAVAGQVRAAQQRLESFGRAYNHVDWFRESIGLSVGEVVDGKHGREDYVRFQTELGKRHATIAHRLMLLAQDIDAFAMELDAVGWMSQERPRVAASE